MSMPLFQHICSAVLFGYSSSQYFGHLGTFTRVAEPLWECNVASVCKSVSTFWFANFWFGHACHCWSMRKKTSWDVTTECLGILALSEGEQSHCGSVMVLQCVKVYRLFALQSLSTLWLCQTSVLTNRVVANFFGATSGSWKMLAGSPPGALLPF